MNDEKVTTRVDVLRHRVGECPACRGYLWADITVETRTNPPTLSVDGKGAVYADARPFAASLTHQCGPQSKEDA